ncbi:MAG: PDZ domain-containing protein [Kofleriaceae bacterium]
MYDRNELNKLATALGGLPVLACRAGSPADEAGVRYGDILLAVNGVPTPDWGTFIEARAKDSKKMQLELFRGGEHLCLEIVLAPAAPMDPRDLLSELIAERIVPLGLIDSKPAEPNKPS